MGMFSHPVTVLPDIRGLESWRNTFNRSIQNKEEDELIFHYLVIVSVRNVLLSSTPLGKLTKDYVGKVLIPVVTTLIEILNDYTGTDGSVESVKKNLRAARVRLNDALELYEPKKDPALIHGKNKALSDTEEELTKALGYWHHIRKKVEERDRQITSGSKGF